MTNKVNSNFSFLLRRNLKGSPEKLKQTAYVDSLFYGYGANVCDPYNKYNSYKVERVQRRTARFVKSRYKRYSSVLICFMSWDVRFFLKGDMMLD